jgi:hypothetical protein
MSRPYWARLRRWPRNRIALRTLFVAAVLALAGGLAAPAQAAVGTSVYTYNRPSTVELGGAEYMGWADQSSSGQVHVAKMNGSGGQSASWTESSSTYLATGPTIAGSNGELAVAWTDSEGTLRLAETTGGGGGGFKCETIVNQYLFDNDGVYSLPNSFYAVATPYLTSEGDDGSGRLYLTWVSDNGSYLHVTQFDAPGPSGCGSGFTAVSNTNFSDTSWDGPAMVVSGYGTSSEHYWLMWAGTDSGHHLNIAEYDTSWNRLSKNTESSHATLTDMGGGYLTSGKTIWMSYCGTNNDVYYQEFTTTSGGPETQVPFGVTCDVNQYNGYYSGGVGVSYEYSTGLMLLSWADATSYQVEQDTT